MVTTASYQASIPGFVKHLNITDDEAVKLMTLSVSLAREAVDEYSKEKKGNRTVLLILTKYLEDILDLDSYFPLLCLGNAT